MLECVKSRVTNLGCIDHLYCFFSSHLHCLQSLSSSHVNSNILRASSFFSFWFSFFHSPSNGPSHAHMRRHRFNSVALRVPLKSFFVLLLTLRYQDQHILLNHAACQIWHYQVFGCQLTNVELPVVQDPQLGFAIGSWHLFHVPWMLWMAMAEEESRPLGAKSDRCITLGGPHFANQPGRCWECEYIDFTYSMCHMLSWNRC